MTKYVIGIDYGTDSCRGVVVDCQNGMEIAESVFYYPRWKSGKYCNQSLSMYRQHPLDYIEGLHDILKNLTNTVDDSIRTHIVGISVDTTGSTPCVVNNEGVPLALTEGFEEDPDAMFVLWKDHTSVEEAETITHVAKTWGGIDYTMYIGGVYSSEWYFAKLLHLFKVSPKVKEAFGSFVEHCDYIPAYLTGVKDARNIKRSRCAAGHKAMWHENFDGLPSETFLIKVDPLFENVRKKLYETTYTADISAGKIDKGIARQYNLSEDIEVGIGAFDCHMGAVGGNINTNALVKVIGTSTCDIVVKKNEEVENLLIDGICGQVDGSVIPGMLGMEAGQSAFGDFYAWYKQLLEWPLQFLENENEKEKIVAQLLFELENKASTLPPSTIVTLDWINGRRTPYANQHLKTAIMGLDLSSDAPKIYRSIIESTVFGAKAIVDRFLESGIKLEEIIAIGGVAKKSKLAMQIMADVTNMNVKVCESEQTVALGAACFAAVVSGVYTRVEVAQAHMASKIEKIYEPNSESVAAYKVTYEKFLKFADVIESAFY